MSTGDHFLTRKAILINLFNPNHIGVKYSLVIFVRGGGHVSYLSYLLFASNRHNEKNEEIWRYIFPLVYS